MTDNLQTFFACDKIFNALNKCILSTNTFSTYSFQFPLRNNSEKTTLFLAKDCEPEFKKFKEETKKNMIQFKYQELYPLNNKNAIDVDTVVMIAFKNNGAEKKLSIYTMDSTPFGI